MNFIEDRPKNANKAVATAKKKGATGLFKRFLKKYGFAISVYILIALVFLGGFIIGLFVGAERAAAENPAPVTVRVLPTVTTNNPPQYAEMDVIATAYCACKDCCGKTDGITATGTKATAGRTIAVDPTVIPYGAEVVINGRTYIAEDCGGAIKGNRIDVYFDTHAEALQFGKQDVKAFVKGVYK